MSILNCYVLIDTIRIRICYERDAHMGIAMGLDRFSLLKTETEIPKRKWTKCINVFNN